MARKTKLPKVITYIKLRGADPVLFSSLDNDTKKRVSKQLCKQIGEGVSDYFANHPEEFETFAAVAEKHGATIECF